MYESCIKYSRTPEERNNQMLSWSRPDRAFYASGACHILAFTFKSLYPSRNLEIIHIKPIDRYGAVGTHVYVRDGEWAFDFNGWTREERLLTATKEDWSHKFPGWGYTTEVVSDDLEAFCSKTDHRPPAYFAFLPWARTYNYIAQFDSKPPSY